MLGILEWIGSAMGAMFLLLVVAIMVAGWIKAATTSR